jgi:hypothetical protein
VKLSPPLPHTPVDGSCACAWRCAWLYALPITLTLALALGPILPSAAASFSFSFKAPCYCMRTRVRDGGSNVCTCRVWSHCLQGARRQSLCLPSEAHLGVGRLCLPLPMSEELSSSFPTVACCSENSQKRVPKLCISGENFFRQFDNIPS